MGGSSHSEPCAATTAPRFPSALPQYEYLGYLGGGGMGEIYKARHIHLDRLVVIKWLRSDLAAGPQLDARFAREMLAVGQLNHPNIVAATDAGIADGRRYLVMEYIDGLDLAELCRRVGRLSIADACEVIRQAATGLAHAHERGIVHRDIKPTNLMLARDGTVKLLDLGLALLQQEGETGGDAPLTRADSGPFGTYDYMSPEQWNNSHEVDPRGDIYSLGCTLYFLLTGHAPYDTPQHKSVTSKMRGHVLEDVPSLRKDRPDVPKKLAALVERMLAKAPEDRCQSATQLAAEIEAFAHQCDLPSLSAAARGITVGEDGPEVQTDPESQTIVGGSSRGGAKSGAGGRKTNPATGLETAVGRPKPQRRGVFGARSQPQHRSPVSWVPIGIAAAAFTVVASGFVLSYLGRGERQHGDNIAAPMDDAPGPDVPDQPPPAAPSVAAAPAPQSDQRPSVVMEATPDAAPAAPSVNAVPRIQPVWDELPPQVAHEGEEFTLLVSLANRAELSGKAVFALGPDSPPGMRIDPETGVVRWTPREEDGGPDAQMLFTVKVKPLDASVAAAEMTFAVRVEEVNTPPLVKVVNGAAPGAAMTVDVAATEGESVEALIEIDDGDIPANPLTLASLQPLPKDATLTPVADRARVWRLAWTPGEEHGGGEAVDVRLRVSDGTASGAPVALVFKVAEVNQPPRIASIAGRGLDAGRKTTLQAREGTEVEFAVVLQDDDLPANALSLEPVGRLPDGARLAPDTGEPQTWKLRWTPGEEAGGNMPTRISLRPRDEESAGAPVTIEFNVAEVNVAPSFRSLGGKPFDAGKPLELQAKEGVRLDVVVVADDIDLPANSLQLASVGPLPEGATIEPLPDAPRSWKLTWTPGEEHGGGPPVEFSLRVSDGIDATDPSRLIVRVEEVNLPPVLPEIPPQIVGAVDGLTLDIPVGDPDLPRQDLILELEQPEGMGATARWLESEEGPRLLRVSWRPDAVADLGTRRTLTLRVRDAGEPPLSVERTFELEVGRYVRNSIGMEFALVPAGEFRMGNLHPEELQKLIPKAPPKPLKPGRPGAPGSPLRNPAVPNPALVPDAPGGQESVEGADLASDGARLAVEKPDDEPVRTLTFALPRFLGAFEVTQEQFQSVMETNPSYFSPNGRGKSSLGDVPAGRLPVESVSYADAVEFCRRLSARPEERARGRTYRLPTEAEWEYACRAGTESFFHTGDRLSSTQANFDGRYPMLGTEPGPYLERTAPVGSFAPNAFGLHDMHGNVSEWCHDWYAADAYAKDVGPEGPDTGTKRVFRGGNYRSQWAYQCRSSIRDARPPTDRVPRIGFRVVMEQERAGPALPARGD